MAALSVAAPASAATVVTADRMLDVATGRYVGPQNVVDKTYRPRLKGDSAKIREAVELMATAKRPVLYTGGGVINSGPEASRLLRELAAATGVNGMVGGQYIDVRGMADNGQTDLRRLHELKTGRLIGAAVLCVLLLTGTDDPSPRLSAFRAFAAELGVLFQIVDDILDVTGTDDALGKPRGSDERHGKLTYVSRYGVEEARALAAESHAKARAALARAAPDGATELEQITDFIYTRPT